MALTTDKLLNIDRFNTDKEFLQFLVYLPFGLIILTVRIFLALILWIASILLPNKWAVRQLLTTLACWTFGVYVKLKGERDGRCSVLVANYVSCLDSLAAAHALGTISLRKWKVPPFFASALGIRNAAQFARKQHFAESPSKPVLVQPEGGPTNGAGLLQFTDWPFQMGNRVQPVAISVNRWWSNVCISREYKSGFPWKDALWFVLSPFTVVTLTALPTVEKHDDDDQVFQDNIRQSIAQALKIPLTNYRWEQLVSRPSLRHGAGAGAGGASARGSARAADDELERLALQVKEVLPRVPISDIIRDLGNTRSVDVTITNFLEGLTPYFPEAVSPHAADDAAPTTSHATPTPKYITPAPTGTFPKSAKERQLSFQERKCEMIAEARRRYIEKHGLNVALS